MSIYTYSSRSYQHGIEHEECMALAEQVVEWLENNPVLTRAMLVVTKNGHMHILDLKAEIDCIGTDALSRLCALDAADEAFIDALREAEASTEVCRSQINVQRPVA